MGYGLHCILYALYTLVVVIHTLVVVIHDLHAATVPTRGKTELRLWHPVFAGPHRRVVNIRMDGGEPAFVVVSSVFSPSPPPRARQQTQTPALKLLLPNSNPNLDRTHHERHRRPRACRHPVPRQEQGQGPPVGVGHVVRRRCGSRCCRCGHDERQERG